MSIYKNFIFFRNDMSHLMDIIYKYVLSILQNSVGRIYTRMRKLMTRDIDCLELIAPIKVC